MALGRRKDEDWAEGAHWEKCLRADRGEEGRAYSIWEVVEDGREARAEGAAVGMKGREGHEVS